MESAKIKALLYADLFDYPLTAPELERWKINDNSKFNPSTPSISLRTSSLRARIQNSKFEEARGYFYLKGRKKIIEQRLAREIISQKKLEKAERAATLLRKIPFIKLLAVTGSLAMQNSQKQEDIDFLIITQKGTLWLTRFLATLLLDLKGLRRKPHQKNVTDKICLNMFLEDGYWALPANERDLYGAHEVCQIKPLFDKDATYRQFLKANSWAKKFLPNAIPVANGKWQTANGKRNKLDARRWALDAIDQVTKIFQLLYMRKRRTTEVILPHLIRFHPKDYRTWVLKKYAEKI